MLCAHNRCSRVKCCSICLHFADMLHCCEIAVVQELLPGMLDGKVVETCTSQQHDHFGLIQAASDENEASYVFGIANLVDKQEVLQKGDSIRFQLATVRSTGKRIATNIASTRRFLRARIDSIKGQVWRVTVCS